ncbi:hypothetical protein NMY22_g9596 [Coprinellus aureogranulatus]|nr:hypothetical protein NMY22_g9596 [Coprinellus aureogranulatus]
MRPISLAVVSSGTLVSLFVGHVQALNLQFSRRAVGAHNHISSPTPLGAGFHNLLGASEGSHSLAAGDGDGKDSTSLGNIGDVRYTTNITLNNKVIHVALDTGSTDLWFDISLYPTTESPTLTHTSNRVLPPMTSVPGMIQVSLSSSAMGMGAMAFRVRLELHLLNSETTRSIDKASVNVLSLRRPAMLTFTLAFLHAETSTIGKMTELGINGLLGLSFNVVQASPINAAIKAVEGDGATWGHSVLHNIFDQHPSYTPGTLKFSGERRRIFHRTSGESAGVNQRCSSTIDGYHHHPATTPVIGIGAWEDREDGSYRKGSGNHTHACIRRSSMNISGWVSGTQKGGYHWRIPPLYNDPRRASLYYTPSQQRISVNVDENRQFTANLRSPGVLLQHPDEPNYLAIDLARTHDWEDTDGGSFGIGEVEEKYAGVLNAPKLPQYPKGGSRWTVLLEGITVNGSPVELQSTIPGVPSGRMQALLDTGDPAALMPPFLRDAIYSKIPGAVFWDQEDGERAWIVPCNTTANVVFTFGGEDFPVHPLDLTSIRQASDGSDSYAFCLASFIGVGKGWAGDDYEISLGDAFLRNVYSLYDFGDAQTGEPYVQLLAQTDPGKASAQVPVIRAETMKDYPPELDTKDFLALLESSSGSASSSGPAKPAEKPSIPKPSSTSSPGDSEAASDQPSVVAASTGPYGPVIIALLSANLIVTLVVAVFAVLNYIRRGRSSAPTYIANSGPTYVPRVGHLMRKRTAAKRPYRVFPQNLHLDLDNSPPPRVRQRESWNTSRSSISMPHSHHSHSGQFCKHASGRLEEVVLEAIRQGFEIYGLTEHAPRYRDEDLYPEEAGLDPDALMKQFEDFLEEAHRLKAHYAPQITLLVGLETEYISEKDLDGLDALLERFGDRVEYIVGSIHHVQTVPIDFDIPTYDKALSLFASDGSAPDPHYRLFLEYFDAQYTLLQRFKPEVIGHFDLCRLFAPHYVFSEYPAVWEKVIRNIRYAVEYGALFEVNAAAFRKKWNTAYPGEEVLKVSASVPNNAPPADIIITFGRLFSMRVAALPYQTIATVPMLLD